MVVDFASLSSMLIKSSGFAGANAQRLKPLMINDGGFAELNERMDLSL
jgi:hypothetical protein